MAQQEDPSKKITIETPIGFPSNNEVNIAKASNQPTVEDPNYSPSLPKLTEMMPDISEGSSVSADIMNQYKRVIPADFNQRSADYLRGADQGTMSTAWNTFKVGTNNFLAGIGMGLGYAVDLQDVFNHVAGIETDYNNWFSKSVEENFKMNADEHIFQKEPGSMDFTDPAFYGQVVGDLAFSAGMMAPAVAQAMLTKKMPIAKGMTPTTKMLLNNATAAITQRLGEGMMEASDTSKKVYSDAMALGYSDEQAKAMAGKAGSSVYNENMKLVVLDYLQMATVFGNGTNLAGLRGSGYQRFMDKKYVKLPLSMASEGAEELYQYVVGEQAADDALRGSYLPEKSILGRSLESLGDPDAQRAMLSGALGGGVFETLGSKFANLAQGKKYRDMVKENQLGLEDTHTPDQISKVQDDAFLDLATRHANAKSMDSLQNYLDSLDKVPREEIEATGVEYDKFKEDLAKRKEQTVEIGKIYNNIFTQKAPWEVRAFAYNEVKKRIAKGYAGKVILDAEQQTFTNDLNTILSDESTKGNLQNVDHQNFINSLISEELDKYDTRNEAEAQALAELKKEYGNIRPGTKRMPLASDTDINSKIEGLTSVLFEKRLVDNSLLDLKKVSVQKDLVKKLSVLKEEQEAEVAAEEAAAAEVAVKETADQEQAENADLAKRAEAQKEREVDIFALDGITTKLADIVAEDGVESLDPTQKAQYDKFKGTVDEKAEKLRAIKENAKKNAETPAPAKTVEEAKAAAEPLSEKERHALYDLKYTKKEVAAMTPLLGRDLIKNNVKKKPIKKTSNPKAEEVVLEKPNKPVVEPSKDTKEDLLPPKDQREAKYNLQFEYSRANSVGNKLAIFSRAFFESFFADESDNGIVIKRQSYENKLYEGMPEPKILSEKFYPEGSELTFVVRDNPNQPMYAGKNDRTETTWGKFKAESGIKREDLYLYVPIEVQDKSGKTIAFIHNENWISDSNLDTTDKTLDDYYNELSQLRKALVDNVKTTGVISQRGAGTLARSANNEPILVSQAMPNSRIVVLREAASTGDKNVDEDLAEFADATGVNLYRGDVLAYVPGKYPVFAFTEGRGFNKTEVDSMIRALENYFIGEDSFGESVKKNMGIDLSTHVGVREYLRHFINFTDVPRIITDKPVSKSFNSHLHEYITNQNRETGEFFVALSGNGIEWAEGGGVGGLNVTTNSGSVGVKRELLSRLAIQLSKMELNVNRDLLGKKVKLVTSEEGSVKEESFDYSDFIKDSRTTTVIGFNVGSEDNPEWVYRLNPIINFEVGSDNIHVPDSGAAFTSPEEVTVFEEELPVVDNTNPPVHVGADGQMITYQEVRELDLKKRRKNLQLVTLLRTKYNLSRRDAANAANTYKSYQQGSLSPEALYLNDLKIEKSNAPRRPISAKIIAEAGNLDVGFDPRGMVMNYLLTGKVAPQLVESLFKASVLEVKSRTSYIDPKGKGPKTFDRLAEMVWEDAGSPEQVDTSDLVNAAEEIVSEFRTRTEIAENMLKVFGAQASVDHEIKEIEKALDEKPTEIPGIPADILAALQKASKAARRESGRPDSDARPITKDQLVELYRLSKDAFLIEGISPSSVERLTRSISSYLINKLVNFEKKNINVETLRDIFDDIRGEMLAQKEVYDTQLAVFDKYAGQMPRVLLDDLELIKGRSDEIGIVLDKYEQLKQLVFLDMSGTSGIEVTEFIEGKKEVGYEDASVEDTEISGADDDSASGDDIYSTDLEEILKDMPGDRGDSYDIYGKLRKTAKQSASTSLKLFLRSLPDKVMVQDDSGNWVLEDSVNSFGLVETLNPDRVFDFLLHEFANKGWHYTAIEERLKELSKDHVWIHSLLNGLDKAGEDMHRDLVSVVNKATVRMRYLLENTDEAGYSASVNEDNIGETTRVVRRGWESNIKSGGLIQSEQGEYFINKELQKHWVEWGTKWFSEAKDSSREKSKKLPPPEEFKKFLSLFGIKINDKLFETIVKGTTVHTSSGRTFRTGMPYRDKKLVFADQFTTKEGIVTNLVQVLRNMAEYNGKIKIDFNEIYTSGIIESLAMLEAKDNPNVRSSSFRSGDKSISSHADFSYIAKRTLDLVNGKISQLIDKNFNGQAFWVKEFKNNDFRKYLRDSLVSLSPIRERSKINFNKEYKNHDELNKEKVKLQYFQTEKEITLPGDVKKRIASYFYMTLGNNSQVVTIDGPKEDFFVPVSEDPDVNSDMYQGLVTDKMVNYIYNSLFMSEVKRMALSKESPTDSFDRGKNIFFALPFLNNLKDYLADEAANEGFRVVDIFDSEHRLLYDQDPTLIITNQGKINTIKRAIKKDLEAKIGKKLTKWQRLGMGFDFKYPNMNKKYVQRVEQAVGRGANQTVIMKSMAADFVVNNMLALHSMNAMYVGDLALYYKQFKGNKGKKLNDPRYNFTKDVDATLQGLFKRLRTEAGPAAQQFANDKPLDAETIPVLIIDDIYLKLSDADRSFYQDVVGLDKESIDQYDNINVADGTTFNHPLEHLDSMWRFKKISRFEYVKAKQYFEANGTFPEWLNITTLKTRYLDHLDTGEHSVRTHFKHAEFFLSPDMVQGNPVLSRIYDLMGGKEGGIKKVAFASTFKTGMKAAYKLVNEDGSINTTPPAPDNYVNITRSGLQLQTNTPNREKDRYTTMSTQAVKQLFTDVSEYFPGLKAEFVGLYNDIIKEQAQDFYDSIGYNSKTNVFDIDKFSSKLRDHLKRYTNDINIIKSVDIVEKELRRRMKTPLFATGAKAMIEPYAMSMVSSIVEDVYFPGTVYNLATELYIAGKTKGVTYVEGFNADEGLRHYRKEGENIQRSQIIMSWPFPNLKMEDFKNRDGNIDLSLFPKELLEIIGTRIPVSKQSSIHALEIVGFLPKNYKGVIVASNQFITQTSWDFDDDKLFFYYKEYEKSEGTGLPEIVKDSKKSKMLDIYAKVILSNNEEVRKVIHRPVSTDLLKPVYDALYYKQTAQMDVSPVSEDYYARVYQNESSANELVGVMANLLNMHSTIMDVPEMHAIKVKIGPSFVSIAGQTSDRILGKKYDYLGNNISDNISNGLQVAVDNANLGWLQAMNVNNYTFSALTQAILEGFSIDVAFALINQDVIKKYIEIQDTLRRSNTKKSKRLMMFDELEKAYPNPKIREIIEDAEIPYSLKVEAILEYGASLQSGSILSEEDRGTYLLGEYEPGDQINWESLFSFLTLNDAGRKVAYAQQNVAVDSKGYGKNLFLADEKIDFPLFLGLDKSIENFGQILGDYQVLDHPDDSLLEKGYEFLGVDQQEAKIAFVYLKPMTIFGSAVTVGRKAILDTLLNKEHLIYPYHTNAYQTLVSRMLGVLGVKERDYFEKNKIKGLIYNNALSFLNSRYMTNLYNEPNSYNEGSALTQRRADLTIDTDTNMSVAMLLDYAKEDPFFKMNHLVKNLLPVLETNGESSDIEYNGIQRDEISRNSLYMGFYDLLFSNRQIQGTEVTGRQFAEMLVELAYINGGTQHSKNFVKIIPIDYLEVKGYNDFLYSLDYTDPAIFGIGDNVSSNIMGRFELSFVRHYPELIPAYKTDVNATIARRKMKMAVPAELKEAPPAFLRYVDTKNGDHLYHFDGKDYKKLELLRKYPNTQYDANVDYNQPVQASLQFPFGTQFNGYTSGDVTTEFVKTKLTGPDPQALHDEYTDKKSTTQILENIEQFSTNKDNRDLAKFIRESYKALKLNVNVEVDFYLRDLKRERETGKEQRLLGLTIYGLTAEDPDIIKLDPSFHRSAAQYEQTILHEMLHPIIDKTVMTYASSTGTTNRKIANNIKTLRDVHELFRKRLKAEFGSLDPQHLGRTLPKELHDLINASGSFQEFVDEAVSSNVVRQYLNQGIWEGQKTLLDRFLEAITNLLKEIGVTWGDRLGDRVVSIIKDQREIVIQDKLDNFKIIKDTIEAAGKIQKETFGNISSATQRKESLDLKYGEGIATGPERIDGGYEVTIDYGKVLDYMFSKLPEAFDSQNIEEVEEVTDPIIKGPISIEALLDSAAESLPGHANENKFDIPKEEEYHAFDTMEDAVAKQRTLIAQYGPKKVSSVRFEGGSYVVEVFSNEDEKFFFSNYEYLYPNRARARKREEAKAGARTKEEIITSKIYERRKELNQILSLVQNAYYDNEIDKDTKTLDKINSLEKQIHELEASAKIFNKKRNVETIERYMKDRLRIISELIAQPNLLIFEQDKILNELNWLVGINSPDNQENFLLGEYWDVPIIREKFSQLSKEAADLRSTYNRTLINTITSIANQKKADGTLVTKDDIMKKLIDVDDLTAQTNNIFRVTDDPLVETIARIINEVLLETSIQNTEAYEKLDNSIAKVMKKSPNKKDPFNLFFQNGKNYLTHFFSDEYFKQIGDIWLYKSERGGVRDKVIPWLKENTNFIDPRRLFPTFDGDIYHYSDTTYSDEDRVKYINSLKEEYGDYVFDRIKREVLNNVISFKNAYELKASTLAANPDLTPEDRVKQLKDFELSTSPFAIAEHVLDGSKKRGIKIDWSYATQPPKRFKTVGGVKTSTGLVNEEFFKISEDADYLEFWEQAYDILRTVNTLDKEASRSILHDQAIPFMEQRFTEAYLASPTKFETVGKTLYDNMVKGISGTDAEYMDYSKKNIQGNPLFRTKNPIVDDQKQIAEIQQRMRYEYIADIHQVDNATQLKGVLDRWGIPSDRIVEDYAAGRTNIAALMTFNASFLRYPEIDRRIKSMAHKEYFAKTSKDLGTILKYNLSLSNTYKNAYRVESIMNIAADIFDRKQVGKKNAMGEDVLVGENTTLPTASDTNIRKMLNYQLHVFFGGARKGKGIAFKDKVYTTEEKKAKKRLEEKRDKKGTDPILKEVLQSEIDKIGNPVYVNSMIDSILNYVHVLGLSYRVVSGNANFWVGMATNNIESASGRFFSDKAFLRANKMLRFSVAKNFSFNTFESPTAKKIRGVMDRNNFLNDATTELFKSSAMTPISKKFRWAAPQQIVSRIEYLIQGNIVIAYMLDHKLSEFLPEHTGTESIYDCFDADGRWNQEKFPITHTQYSNIMLQIKQVKETLQGSYDFDRTLLAKQTLGGRILFSFHTWVPEFIKVRFQKERTDPFLGKKLKGRYLTIGQFLMNGLNDQSLSSNVKAAAQMLIGKATYDGRFTEHDAANMRSFIREVSMITTLVVARLMLKGIANLGDDDKYNDTENFLIFYLLNSATRLQADLSTLYRFASGEDAQRSVVPIFSIVKQFDQLLGAAGGVLVGQEGEDVDRLLKSVSSFFPGLTEIDRTKEFLSKSKDKGSTLEKAILGPSR